MPTYNKSRYIEKTIQSVLAQSYKEFELIIINDGSTDNTLDICRNFASQDERIKIIDIPNGGVSNARNVGMKAATGVYLSFMDSDDYIGTDWIKNLVDDYEKNDVDIVISGLTDVDESGNILRKIKPEIFGKKKFDDIKNTLADTQSKNGLYGYAVAKFFKRSLAIDNNVFFDKEISLAEDVEFVLKLLQYVDTIYYSDNEAYFYIQDAENSSVRIDDSQINYFSQIIVFLTFTNLLKKRDAYDGFNKKYIESRINDYIYFSVFYNQLKSKADFILFIKKIIDDPRIFGVICYDERTGIQKIVLKFLKEKKISQLFFVLKFRKTLRKMLGR